METGKIANLFIEELRVRSAPYGLEYPKELINQLIARHVAICENPDVKVDQEEIEFSFNFSDFAIDSQVLPYSKQTLVNVYVKSPHRRHIFGFTFLHEQPHNNIVNLTTTEGNAMKIKITNASEIIKKIEELAKEKQLVIPAIVFGDLIKHCEESISRGAPGGIKKDFSFSKENDSATKILVCELYPISKTVHIWLESTNSLAPLFKFDGEFTVENITDKDIDMNEQHVSEVDLHAGNVVKSNSFRAAADMIESIFNMEQWRRDGEVEDKLKTLSAGQAAKIMVDDLSHMTLEKLSIDSAEGHKVKADFNGSTLIFLINQAEKEEDDYRAPFKGIIGNLRTKLFLNKLKHSSSPIEAFNLLTEWLGEDQEAEGKFSYKDMVIVYSFEYDKHDRSISASLSIGNKVKCDSCGKAHEMESIFAFTSNFTAENVDKFYDSVKMFAETFLK